MEAKNKMIFGRLENRILRPQKQIADEVRRYVRVRGKEQKDGGRPLSQESEASFWKQALEAGTERMKCLSSGTHGSPFGRRRMCFARTAALQVETKSRR